MPLRKNFVPLQKILCLLKKFVPFEKTSCVVKKFVPFEKSSCLVKKFVPLKNVCATLAITFYTSDKVDALVKDSGGISNILAIGKHLCGGATDLSLRCLLNNHNNKR